MHFEASSTERAALKTFSSKRKNLVAFLWNDCNLNQSICIYYCFLCVLCVWWLLHQHHTTHNVDVKLVGTCQFILALFVYFTVHADWLVSRRFCVDRSNTIANLNLIIYLFILAKACGRYLGDIFTGLPFFLSDRSLQAAPSLAGPPKIRFGTKIQHT